MSTRKPSFDAAVFEDREGQTRVRVSVGDRQLEPRVLTDDERDMLLHVMRGDPAFAEEFDRQ